MKTALLIATLAATLIWATQAYAEDAHHPESAAPNASAAPSAADPALAGMQENAKKAAAQIERIAKAKSAKERQQALAEHLRTMEEGLMMARALKKPEMSCPMMEGGMPEMHMMMHRQAEPEREAMMMRMHEMEKRMDMMQMMMEQAMRRGDSPPAQAK
jgi:hypothetical protein